MADPGITPPEPLGAHHDRSYFDSGTPELDDWLRHRAQLNEASGASRTYVACTDDTIVVGFYALSAFALHRSTVAGRIRRNMPEPIPAILLGRLAVDHRYQQIGLGSALLRDAMRRVLATARAVGVRVLVAQAIDEAAKRFYMQRGFDATATDPMLLVVLVDTLGASLAEPDVRH